MAISNHYARKPIGVLIRGRHTVAGYGVQVNVSRALFGLRPLDLIEYARAFSCKPPRRRKATVPAHDIYALGLPKVARDERFVEGFTETQIYQSRHHGAYHSRVDFDQPQASVGRHQFHMGSAPIAPQRIQDREYVRLDISMAIAARGEAAASNRKGR